MSVVAWLVVTVVWQFVKDELVLRRRLLLLLIATMRMKSIRIAQLAGRIVSAMRNSAHVREHPVLAQDNPEFIVLGFGGIPAGATSFLFSLALESQFLLLFAHIDHLGTVGASVGLRAS